MATEKKTAVTEGLSVEERLKTLYQLQTLLSQIDRIKNLRGELPLEVKDMDDEVERLKTRNQIKYGQRDKTKVVARTTFAAGL